MPSTNIPKMEELVAAPLMGAFSHKKKSDVREPRRRSRHNTGHSEEANNNPESNIEKMDVTSTFKVKLTKKRCERI